MGFLEVLQVVGDGRGGDFLLGVRLAPFEGVFLGSEQVFRFVAG
jgi:hypothetical protein